MEKSINKTKRVVYVVKSHVGIHVDIRCTIDPKVEEMVYHTVYGLMHGDKITHPLLLNDDYS